MSDTPSGRPVTTPEIRRERRRGLREDALNVPNLLTFGRIAVIPLVLWLIDQATPRDCVYAALAYSAAAITDLLDGWLARRMGIVSVLGKFLDPLADKLLVMATLVWLVPMGRIPEWAVVLLLARELTINGLRSIASSEGVVIAAGGGGKSKTALQMVGILCLILGYPYEIDLGLFSFGTVDLVVVGRVLVYISLVFSLASAVEYVNLFARAVEAKAKARTDG
ncbi:MAG TPA: CDP-diacylglycerol--glycerol-3-phosphate 3-phosphatidyltransferase [Polyangiaceae bacterium]|nr:CDP-diacylglycerol--glycerol-3-phosphate 3-phosphatidyltransferase [Polyangiaceae bacterium]